MKRFLHYIVKHWEDIIAASALSVMLIVAIINVFFRYVLNSPITWAEELECICLVWSTFLGAAAAYKLNLHYGMDFLVDHLPFTGKLFLRRTITFICIILFGFLTVLAVQFCLKATKITAFFRLSYKVIDFSAVLGFASMTVYSVIYFIESFTAKDKYISRYLLTIDEENTV